MISPHAGAGLSRFAADLPAVSGFVSMGEGHTPLVPLPALAAQLGLRRVSAKLESVNPTGSYKDRVAAMSLSLARDRGDRGWIATSSGNAGLAMAAYGARAGLPGFLCLVATAPMEKRLPLMPYATRVVAVDGVGDDGDPRAAVTLMTQVQAAAQHHRLFLGITAHAFNPDGMRGIDTIGYELGEQAPDLSHVYVPTGGGGLLAAVARGLTRRGMSPRIICCQPAGCAPIVGFLDGQLAAPQVPQCTSGISALQLPHPPDGALAATAVTTSGGWGTAVDDAAILAAQRLLARVEGIFVEPAAAATVAALIDDTATGRIGPDEHPVLLLSGAGWKDLHRFSTDSQRIPLAQPEQVRDCVDRWAHTELRASVTNHSTSNAKDSR